MRHLSHSHLSQHTRLTVFKHIGLARTTSDLERNAQINRLYSTFHLPACNLLFTHYFYKSSGDQGTVIDKYHAHFYAGFLFPFTKADKRMKLVDIPFCTTDWSQIVPTEHAGETGLALWRTQHFGEVRVRIVEYSAGYLADHWCSKGHVLFCLEGELQTRLDNGRIFTLTPGMSYQVADDAEAHQSSTVKGAKLFVVD